MTSYQHTIMSLVGVLTLDYSIRIACRELIPIGPLLDLHAYNFRLNRDRKC